VEETENRERSAAAVGGLGSASAVGGEGSAAAGKVPVTVGRERREQE
jgi:hypothetical protein